MALRRYQEREANQNQSKNKMNNMFHEADNRRDLHRVPLSDHLISSSYSSAFTPPSASGLPKASGSSAAVFLPPRTHSSTFLKNENLNSSFTGYGSRGKKIQSHADEISSFSALEISSSNSRHPFDSDEIEECDKYNPLILHHAQIQSVAQYRENRSPLRKAYPLSRGYDSQKDYTQRSGGNPQEPRSHRHNLLYNQKLCQRDGTARVLTPKAASAASTTKSIALAHTTTSPSASSSYVTNTSSSTAFTNSTKDKNAYKDPNLEGDGQKSSISRRMSLPEPPPMDRTPSRRMSYTITSPPRLLDTIFQRVWNPQQTSPVSNLLPLPSTDDDSQTKNINQGQETASSSSSIQIRNPSSFLIMGNNLPHGYSPCGDYLEGHQPRRYNGRFINQVTFSLDESHKSGIQAILVLRRLTNGLTSDKVTPQPRVPGSRYGYPNIPVPRISHRYPEQSTTTVINGKVRVVNKKTIPSVVINWSDGVREEFDPTGMSLDDILGRCYCNERYVS